MALAEQTALRRLITLACMGTVAGFLSACDEGEAEPLGPWTGPSVQVEGTPVNLGPLVNSPASEFNPELSSDGRHLYFSSLREGGHGSNDLYVATRESPDHPWGEPQNLGPAINTAGWETGPSMTDDMLELYFTRKNWDSGERNLYVARRASVDEPFSEVEKLPPPINTGSTDSGCHVSGDGLVIVFSSTREGGHGDRDLYIAERPSRDVPFTEVRNMGERINSPSMDSSPAMSPDMLTLYFHSKRHNPKKVDIFMTSRESLDAPWTEPVYLAGLNTIAAHDGTPSLSHDGRELYFRSDRPGGGGYQDIYMIKDPPTRVPLHTASR